MKNKRMLSVVVCAFLFAYLLSFVFEGRVLYGLLAHFETTDNRYIMVAIAVHFVGLATCGLFVKSQKRAKRTLCIGILVCLVSTLPFFFPPSVLWWVGLLVTGFSSGWVFASWGWFLKTCTPKNSRIKSCADVLILSNAMMIVINVVTAHGSAMLGLVLSMLCLVLGLASAQKLPVSDVEPESKLDDEKSPFSDLKKPLLLLCLFVTVITVNSGLMYQVINPAFAHLPGLASWYWAVPYILALAVVRNLAVGTNRAGILYVGMAMLLAAFVCFMLLGRGAADYLVIDTLMLGACGIFDLFWWSIIGEMLEYSGNPVMISGIGLSANVFGVLCGDLLGLWMTSVAIPKAQITVLALCVICVTLALLPVLNRQLVLVLKSNTYLSVYTTMSEPEQTAVLRKIEPLDPLTNREKDILELLLEGKSNKAISATLYISENTVKTHIRSIFSKYVVSSRAELLSSLLKNRISL